MSSDTSRFRKKITIGLPFVLILLGCLFILIQMAIKSNSEFDFHYWNASTQAVGVGVVVCAIWGLFIILIR